MNIPLQKNKLSKAERGKEHSSNFTPADSYEEKIDAERRLFADSRLGKVAAQASKFFDADEELPVSKHIILLSICVFFFFFVLWASFAPLDVTTRGEGRIIPSSDVQKLSSLEGGLIEKMLVREGDEVKAGQVVARLRDVAASSEVGSNQTRYYGLMATIARLQAEVDGKMPNFSEDVMKNAPQAVTEEMNAYRANRDKVSGQTIIFEQQKNQRSQELNELQIKARDLRSQVGLAQDQRAIISPLVEKGSAPRMELLKIDSTIKEKQTELNGTQAAIPRARAAIEEATARIRDVESSARAQSQTELSAKMIEMQALKQGIVGLVDKKDRTEIRSPVDGYIKDIRVYTVGGVVQPGQDFIEIVPKDDQLLVETRIKPKDIAFLYPDQPAMVKITAYDFSIYGGLKGRVVGISPDAVTDEKGESYYLVRVRTDENTLKRKGAVLPIIPGMVATVDILTGEKTVMEYLLKPFVKTLDSAMNER